MCISNHAHLYIEILKETSITSLMKIWSLIGLKSIKFSQMQPLNTRKSSRSSLLKQAQLELPCGEVRKCTGGATASRLFPRHQTQAPDRVQFGVCTRMQTSRHFSCRVDLHGRHCNAVHRAQWCTYCTLQYRRPG